MEMKKSSPTQRGQRRFGVGDRGAPRAGYFDVGAKKLIHRNALVLVLPEPIDIDQGGRRDTDPFAILINRNRVAKDGDDAHFRDGYGGNEMFPRIMHGPDYRADFLARKGGKNEHDALVIRNRPSARRAGSAGLRGPYQAD